MFIRTRDGLPVKSISDNGGQDEVIARRVPPYAASGSSSEAAASGTDLPRISSPKIWSLRPKPTHCVVATRSTGVCWRARIGVSASVGDDGGFEWLHPHPQRSARTSRLMGITDGLLDIEQRDSVSMDWSSSL